MTNWHKYYIYDESSKTCLRHKTKSRTYRVGDEVGNLQDRGSGYRFYRAQTFIDGQHSTAHCKKIVYEMHHKGNVSARHIIHINGDTLDYRIDNLRLIVYRASATEAPIQLPPQTTLDLPEAEPDLAEENAALKQQMQDILDSRAAYIRELSVAKAQCARLEELVTWLRKK